jgi:hypothetical protein
MRAWQIAMIQNLLAANHSGGSADPPAATKSFVLWRALRAKVGVMLAMGTGLLGSSVAHGAPGAPLSFQGAQIGMSRESWDTMQPPGPVSSHTKRACSDEAGTGSPAPTPAEQSAGLVVCTYVDIWGRLHLPVRFPYGANYRVDHLRYGFANDRLIEIRCAVGLDAFNAIVGDFTKRYGRPIGLQRDRVKSELGPLPRVRETWSLPQGSIELIDPILPDDEIGVRLTSLSD